MGGVAVTVGIVGCGLIGGSIGLACRANGHLVVGYEPDGKSAKVALERGCVDQLGSLGEVSTADLVFVCVPPNSIVSTLAEISLLAKRETVVTDCASVKAEVVSWLNDSKLANFVPGHPMAGHEKSGPKFASAWMFRGAKWILTPCSFTDKSALAIVEKVVAEMGATPVRIDAGQHDREVAVLSHLPHALAAILVRMGGKLESTEASAGSWKDLTRVGGVDPNLWTQILMSNRQEVGRVLREFGDDIHILQKAMDDGDGEAVKRFFVEAQQAKEGKS